jgi:hypothetical protein
MVLKIDGGLFDDEIRHDSSVAEGLLSDRGVTVVLHPSLDRFSLVGITCSNRN